MGPYFVTNNQADINIANMKNFSKFNRVKTGGIHLSDFNYLIRRKFGTSTLASKKYSAMLKSILGIIIWSIPSEIYQMTIRRLPVIMATLHTFRARPSKGSEYKKMNHFCESSTIFRKPNPKIWAWIPSITRSQQNWSNYFLWLVNNYPTISIPATSEKPKASNPPMIRNLIPWITGDVFPLFHVWIILVITHGLTSIKGWIVGRAVVLFPAGLRLDLFIA